MSMPNRIRAVFAGGVFKPVGTVDLPDNAEVEISVLDRSGFDQWWEGHAERMRQRTIDITAAEIEEDVGAAFDEARSERRRPA